MPTNETHKYKQETLTEILDSDRQMVIDGNLRYGHHYNNAVEFYNLLQNFIVSISADRFVFSAFIGQIRKHHLLALLSSLRRQHTQSMMNLRYVLESGACAAYAIAHPDTKGFLKESGKGYLISTGKLTGKRYKWLEENYPGGSVAIKNMKDVINKYSAHANLVSAHRNFKFDADQGATQIPFLDFENSFYTKTELWQISNAAMGLMDFFYGVNQDYNAIKFKVGFVTDLKGLEAKNNAIKLEIQKEYPEMVK